MSLFGHNLAPGAAVVAHSRLVVLRNATDAEILDAANQYFNRLPKR